MSSVGERDTDADREKGVYLPFSPLSVSSVHVGPPTPSRTSASYLLPPPPLWRKEEGHQPSLSRCPRKKVTLHSHRSHSRRERRPAPRRPHADTHDDGDSSVYVGSTVRGEVRPSDERVCARERRERGKKGERREREGGRERKEESNTDWVVGAGGRRCSSGGGPRHTTHGRRRGRLTSETVVTGDARRTATTDLKISLGSSQNDLPTLGGLTSANVSLISAHSWLTDHPSLPPNHPCPPPAPYPSPVAGRDGTSLSTSTKDGRPLTTPASSTSPSPWTRRVSTCCDP